MKRSTVIQCRAYLFVGSVAALIIQVAVVGSMLVFDVPAAVFASSAFRVAVVAIVVASVLAAQWVAARSFRVALARHDIVFADEGHSNITLSSQCPRRAFVMLHLRLNPRRFAMAPPRPRAATEGGIKPARSLSPSLLERKPALSRGSTRT